MSRAESLRALARYDIQRLYHWVEGRIDYSKPVSFSVRPKGFRTVLFTVSKPDTTATDDFVGVMDAIANLSQMSPPKIRRRKRK